MEFLLEAGAGMNHFAVNVGIGVTVLLALLVLMGLVHGVGAGRPHS